MSIRRRHRDWYQQLVLQAEAEWISDRQLEWIARLERERQNLREALAFCATEFTESEAGLRIAGALYPFWFSRGLLSEGRRALERALNSSDGQPTVDRVKALYTASVLAGRQGDPDAGTALIDQGRRLVEQLGDPHAHALIRSAEGHLALFSGELPRAITCLADALEHFHTGDDLFLQIENQTVLALSNALRGDTQRAIDCYEKTIEITQAHGEFVYRAYSHWGMALAVWRQGDPGRATGLLEQGLHLTRLVDDPLATAWCLEILAWIAAGDNRAQRAGVLLGAADALRHTVGSPTLIVHHTRGYHGECEQRCRLGLGPRAFDAARSDGQSLGFDGAIAYALGEQSQDAKPSSEPASPLTKREQQVADLVAEGLTNKAVAAKLVISQRTAQGHVEHILTKLGFTSRAQIAAWVVERVQRP